MENNFPHSLSTQPEKLSQCISFLAAVIAVAVAAAVLIDVSFLVGAIAVAAFAVAVAAVATAVSFLSVIVAAAAVAVVDASVSFLSVIAAGVVAVVVVPVAAVAAHAVAATLPGNRPQGMLLSGIRFRSQSRSATSSN